MTLNCSNDTAVFQCTNYRSTFLNWEFLTPKGENSFIGLNSVRHPNGTVLFAKFCSSSLKYTIISANTSFIRATATILDPISVNGTRVTCNADSVVLTVIGHKGMPALLLFHQINIRTVQLQRVYYFNTLVGKCSTSVINCTAIAKPIILVELPLKSTKSTHLSFNCKV